MTVPTPKRADGTAEAAPLLPSIQMHEMTSEATERAGRRTWTIGDLDWSAIRPECLDDADRSVVRFITFIEDHIPGYLAHFLQRFPVATPDLDIEEFCFNREYFRFLVSWAADEERHASALTRYQAEAGMATSEELLTQLAAEGRKPFAIEYDHPVQVFTYTLVQEKATQLFYQQFRDRVREPVLRDLLHRLARDEARHFAFYSHLVGAYLKRDGTRVVPLLKDVLASFRMPLADVLTGYWRWSLRIADIASYDHTESYEALVRLVCGVVDAPGEPSVEDLVSFVSAIRRLQ